MTTKHDFCDGNGPVPAHRHPNGGGWVADTAHVDGTAVVSGNARVCGDAWVSGDAWDRSPLYIQGTMHSVTTCSSTELAIGCEVRTVDEWLRDYETIGKENDYTEAQIAEYGYLIRVAVEWLKHNAPGGE